MTANGIDGSTQRLPPGHGHRAGQLVDGAEQPLPTADVTLRHGEGGWSGVWGTAAEVGRGVGAPTLLHSRWVGPHGLVWYLPRKGPSAYPTGPSQQSP